MKFKSPSDEPMHIALTSGHSIVIEPDGTEVPAIFQKEAVARGAYPVGLDDAAPLAGQTFDRAQVIKDAMNKMLDGSEEDNFTKDGKPDLRKLNALVGFSVARSEADKLFEEVTAAKD
jgi:hypothetical protein